MTTTPAPHRPQPFVPASTISPWFIRLPVLFLTGLLLLLLTLALCLMALMMRYRDTIYPNVWLLGQNIGGMTLKEARESLQFAFDYGERTVFTLRDGERFWQVKASELGVVFDVDATLQQAFGIGHTGSAAADLAAQLSALLRGVVLSPIVRYDQQAALERLNAIAAEIYQPAFNASLVLEGTTLTTAEGQSGRALDVAGTMALLETRLLALSSGGEIPLSIAETPAALATVSDTAQQIRTALSGPVQLVATDVTGAALGPWTATTDQIAQLLRVSSVTNPDGSQSYVASIDGTAFSAYLASLAPGLITPAQNARYHFNEQTRELEVIQPAISGRSLNVAETVKRLEEAVFSADNRVVAMVFDYTLPQYHNQTTAAELGIRELVAEATTFFTGSPQNRRTNIAVSASRFDGLVIAPGQEFSFNYYLGEISEEGGFVEGQVIVGDRTVIGIGGGACQVSTTLFRAAFFGGYAITERNSHGYRVGFYELGGAPPGLDAAIWQPDRDFRFQNNTPHHLLIQVGVYPNSDALQFRFYSTRVFQTEIEPAVVKNITPARPVRYEANRDLQPGEIMQVDYSAEGADVTVYRNVYDLQGNLLTEDYVYTHYLPWGAVYQVAPGDSRLANSG
jgi:vancomycin resistance protein YoaR